MAIGARCQSAKTYLEKNFELFDQIQQWEDLVRHALKALQASAQEVELNEHNVSVAVLGKDLPFKQIVG